MSSSAKLGRGRDFDCSEFGNLTSEMLQETVNRMSVMSVKNEKADRLGNTEEVEAIKKEHFESCS